MADDDDLNLNDDIGGEAPSSSKSGKGVKMDCKRFGCYNSNCNSCCYNYECCKFKSNTDCSCSYG